MKIGFVGLGRMGSNIVLNLLDHEHEVVGYDIDGNLVNKLSKKGMCPAKSYKELIDKLPSKKIIWLMVPSSIVGNCIKQLVPLLNKGDVIIDGGNSYFKDSMRRSKLLAKRKIHFIDCGTSGGIKGARTGACMMVGGNKRIYSKIRTIFEDVCVKNGCGYVGSSGMGHFTKMVHNGIEYSFMGALSEGFNALEKKKLDLKTISKIYANGSIIESRLTSISHDIFKKNLLKKISCRIPKGETEDEMENLEKIAYMPILHQARISRVETRNSKKCGKLISAMRNIFGGHKVIKK